MNRPVNPLAKARKILEEELITTTKWKHTDIELNQLETSRYYQLWKEFFGKDSTIVGVDVNPEYTKFEQKDQGIHVRIGNQADVSFLEDLHKEFGEFDIIIDDGSHLTHHVIATFNYAFLHCLSKSGIYFIEDLNTSYWENYRTSKYSGMDLVLNLCELMNQFYIDHSYKEYARESYPGHFRAPLISTLVSEVRVFDSAAAIYKETRLPPFVFRT